MLDRAANDTMAPRAGELSPHNAQSLFPPSMTVFVAKYVTQSKLWNQLTLLHSLSIHRTEAQLTKSVHEAFDHFGSCAVDIKKDKHKHPYAHVTYCVRTLDLSQRKRLMLLRHLKTRTEP